MQVLGLGRRQKKIHKREHNSTVQRGEKIYKTEGITFMLKIYMRKIQKTSSP